MEMHTDWSAEYVSALFESDLIDDAPLHGRFRAVEMRDAFLEVVEAKGYSGVTVTPVEGIANVLVVVEEKSGTVGKALLEIVQHARSYGGDIMFPGALPK